MYAQKSFASLKRKFQEDETPDNDCLHKASTSSSAHLIQTWPLNYSKFVSLVRSFNGLRIHIREFKQSENGQQFPTKQGITLTLETWFHLSSKIFDFNLAQRETSLICNNQLIVVNSEGECVLQQMFKDGSDKFILKPNSLKLLEDQLPILREHTCEISDTIMEEQFKSLLPQMIAKEKGSLCRFPIHIVDESDALANLLDVLQTELSKIINRLLSCEACNISDPSQFNHLCMTITTSEKLYRAPMNCFILMNFKDVAHHLKVKYCLCPYDVNFFLDKNADFFRTELTKLIDSGKEPLYI